VVLHPPADVVEEAGYEAQAQEPFGLFQEFGPGFDFDVKQGGAVDADPHAVKEPVPEVFLEEGFYDAEHAPHERVREKQLACQRGRGLEPDIELGKRMPGGDPLCFPQHSPGRLIHASRLPIGHGQGGGWAEFRLRSLYMKRGGERRAKDGAQGRANVFFLE
jgi:hypothetical protein